MSREKKSSNKFSERLKEIIGDDSVNLAAQKCGITTPTFSNYIKGISLPGLEFLIAIARTYNVNIEWLATGGGPKHGVYVKPMEPQNLKEKKYPFKNCPDGGIFCQEFGQNLKRIREERGYNVKEFIGDLDLNEEDYNAMEQGFLPGPSFFQEILAPTFKCNPGEFFYGAEYTESRSSVRKIFFENLDKVSNIEIDDIIFGFNEAFHYQITNNSMAPTLHTYDIVLCKKHTDNFRSGIYVLNTGYNEEVRRLTLTHDFNVIVSCDNNLIPSYTVSQFEILKKLVGRVTYIVKAV